MPVIPIDESELLARLQAVLEKVVPGCQVAPLETLSGGASSIVYRTSYGLPGQPAQPVVVKAAPAGIEPVRNRDMLRQARLQKAVESTGVPVPKVLGTDPGTPPDIPPFFVMSFEEGECFEPNFQPPDKRPPPDEVRGREMDAARILGELHRFDPAALGIDEPPVTLESEVERWTNSLAACDEDLRAGTEDLGARLAATVPTMDAPVLIHGDFRLGNVLAKGAKVVSIIDWEIWSVGDPRVDLAWFLMMANPDPSSGRTGAPGMPSERELLDAYSAARGVAVEGMNWFSALVRYKQVSAGAFIARNARRRGQEAPVPGQQGALIDAASSLLDQNS